MVTFRLRGKYIAAFLGGIVLVAVGIFGAMAIWGNGAVAAGASTAGRQNRVTVRTNEERLDFIRSFGWEVEEEPIEVMEVIIPKEFDAVYQEYNSIQRRQGYDLERHAGRRVKRYTYVVTNYPGQPEDVRINLLIRDNRIIGGDVCSLLQDGFIHGFAMPELNTPGGGQI